MLEKVERRSRLSIELTEYASSAEAGEKEQALVLELPEATIIMRPLRTAASVAAFIAVERPPPSDMLPVPPSPALSPADQSTPAMCVPWPLRSQLFGNCGPHASP